MVSWRIFVSSLVALSFSAGVSIAETTTYSYDALGRLVRATQSSGAQTDYTYDAAGNRTQLVAQGGEVTNLLMSPEQMVYLPWSSYSYASGGGVQQSLNAGQDPVGGQTADLLTFSRSDSSGISIWLYNGTASSTATRTSSIYMKAGSSADVGKVLHAWQWQSQAVDIATITLMSQWQRVVLPSTTATDGERPLDFGLLPNSYGTIGASTGQVSVLVWGAQSVLGSSPGAYVPVASVTNLLTSTEQMVHLPWSTYSYGTGSGGQVSLNAGQSPVATQTADLITLSRSDSSGISLWRYNGTASSSATRTSSIYMKAGSSADVGKVLHAWQVLQGTGQIVDIATITLTSQWQRVVLPSTTATDGALPLDFGLLPDSYGTVGASTGQVSVLVWGAQSVLGSTPQTYVPVP